MKKVLLATVVACVALLSRLQAQEVELKAFAPAGGKFGDFSAWQTIVDPAHPDVKTSYRIALERRRGMAAHYIVELKNDGGEKVKGKVYFIYTTVFMPTTTGEKFKFSIGPGETETVKMIVQGCKRKGNDNIGDDYAIASSCPFRYSVEFK
jgi:hypothetical protein